MPEVVMAESYHRGWSGQKIQDARDRLLQCLAYVEPKASAHPHVQQTRLSWRAVNAARRLHFVAYPQHMLSLYFTTPETHPHRGGKETTPLFCANEYGRNDFGQF